ncbi:MAG: hypothetical protein H6625_02630 [Bdellovibrionaceae bacterium]|nr:hypothetical protein [Pseudobdellovibrionaceae bacterium]
MNLLTIIAFLLSTLLYYNAVAEDGSLVIGTYEATLTLSPENSKNLFNYFEDALAENHKDFWVEDVQQVQATADKICGMKLVFKNTKEAITSYVCRYHGNKYVGDPAKKDFEDNIEKLLMTTKTIVGKNIGCTKFDNQKSSTISYECAMAIFENGQTESNAKWIVF